MTRKWHQRALGLILRLCSIGAGLYIEYREVFVVREAQWILVFLGLWFMAVPPALWLDSLRRLTAATSHLTPPTPDQIVDESREPRRRSDDP